MKKDYAFTFAAEATVLTATLVMYRVAATYWEPDVFGEYMLARRTLGLIYAQSLLGLAVSIPRYIAVARPGGASVAQAGRYLLGGLILAGAALLVVGALFLGFPTPIAALFFGDGSYSVLLPPLYACTVGVTMHILAYGYFRGHLRMKRANTLQMINIGLVPLAAFAIPNLRVAGILWITGITWSLLAGGVLLTTVLGEIGIREFRAPDLGRRIRELLRYGLPRLPGDLALTALLTLPATIAAHRSGMEAAGHMAFAIAILGMIGSFFSPIGLVLLPSASAMVARGEVQGLRRNVGRLLVVGIGVTGLGVGLLILIAPTLVTWYLGPEFRSAAGVVRVIGLGAVPYVVYLLLRAPLDAVTVTALNARNLLVGLAVFVILAAAVPNTAGAAWALVAGLSVTGVLTVWDTFHRLRPAVSGPGEDGG